MLAHASVQWLHANAPHTLLPGKIETNGIQLALFVLGHGYRHPGF
jgi:hypothetical protein